MPAGGRVSTAVDATLPPAFYAAIGYRVFAGRALRVDIVERVAAHARKLARLGSFTPSADLLTLAGCTVQEMGEVLAGLGYRPEPENADGVVFFAAPERKRGKRPRRRPGDPDSPFAKLAELRSNR